MQKMIENMENEFILVKVFLEDMEGIRTFNKFY